MTVNNAVPDMNSFAHAGNLLPSNAAFFNGQNRRISQIRPPPGLTKWTSNEANNFDKTIGPPLYYQNTGPYPEEIQSTFGQSSSASRFKIPVKVSSQGMPTLNFCNRYYYLLMNNRCLGHVTGIPGSMLKDQYGMIGEMLNIKLANENPRLVELKMGMNLATLGINSNSPEYLYPSFAGPFADRPLGANRLSYDVPPEYTSISQLM